MSSYTTLNTKLLNSQHGADPTWMFCQLPDDDVSQPQLFLEIRTVAPRWSVLPLTSTTSLTWALATASRSSVWWTCPPPWRRRTRCPRAARPPWWPPNRSRGSSRCSVSPLGSCHLLGCRLILLHHSGPSVTQRWDQSQITTRHHHKGQVSHDIPGSTDYWLLTTDCCHVLS